MKLKEIVKNKTVIWSVVALFVGMMFGGNSTCTDSNHTESVAKVSELQTEVENKSKEIETLNAKIESAKPWFDMKAEEQKAIEEENARLKAEEEARKKAEEEEAKRLAEEEAKKGYDTGITYNQIARTPDDYKGKKIKFKGKVIQVMEGDGEVQIRLAVGGDYDKIIYGVYDSSIVSSRVLEDDNITIMGLSAGLLTYQSTMGGEITIPSMLIEKIDQ